MESPQLGFANEQLSLDRLNLKVSPTESFGTVFRQNFDEPAPSEDYNKPKNDRAYAIAKKWGLTIRLKQDLSVQVLEGRDIISGGKRKTTANSLCKVKLGKQKVKTIVQKKTTDPVWNQYGHISVSTNNLDKKLDVQVLHKTKLGGTKKLGRGEVNLLGLNLEKENDLWVEIMPSKQFDHSETKLGFKHTAQLESSNGEVHLKLQFAPPTIDSFLFDLQILPNSVKMTDIKGAEFIIDGKMGVGANLWVMRKPDSTPLVVIKRNIVLSTFELYEPDLSRDDPTDVEKKRCRMMLVPETIGKTMEVVMAGTVGEASSSGKFAKIKNNKMKAAKDKRTLAWLHPGKEMLDNTASVEVTAFDERFIYYLAAVTMNHVFFAL
eukprot:TRINITY_DN8457_c0_g1_i1.p1 TRINITY_DN8457_c0_g1~~TRINITY_DN8457_c0_g1_i1.p1  ORF type:complete len:378 (+),score=134.25 TRINITY_DN8457_c0_g1_i1:132-1265(+)